MVTTYHIIFRLICKGIIEMELQNLDGPGLVLKLVLRWPPGVAPGVAPGVTSALYSKIDFKSKS